MKDENALNLDWTDFQPENDRDQMALALLVAGIVIDTDKDGAELPGDLVRLDYSTADAVLEALESVGIGLAAIRAAEPPALDPDRLMVAMRNVERHQERFIRWERDAEAIAAEYARLSDSEPRIPHGETE